MQLSVIVPVGPGDESWRGLRLQDLKPGTEVIFSVPELERESWQTARWPEAWSDLKILTVFGPIGRPKQLNLALESVTGEAIWFVHADSRWLENPTPLLEEAFREQPTAFWYFPLRFYDGDFKMWINTLGCYFRSQVQELPYGDQGFFVSKTLADRIGAYDEKAAYGEDHLWVWRGHHLRVPFRTFEMPIYTSARRYMEQGWLKITVLFSLLQWRQGFPEWFRGKLYRLSGGPIEARRVKNG